jgi:DNA polymerase-3 subunit epsilon
VTIGFAVIDLETTGFSAGKSDRVVEIGIVLLDPQGDREGIFETLVNPGRDVGPTHVHGISARDVFDAPSFEVIAPRLVQILRDRALVFHNAQFDKSFLFSELERAGLLVWDASVPVLCTMTLASDFLPGNGRSLEACCQAYDIINPSAHSALADAEATAELLRAYMQQEPDSGIWDEALDAVDATAWPEAVFTEVVTKSRNSPRSIEASFVRDVISRMSEIEGLPHEIELLGLFDEVLSDGEISDDEVTVIQDFAQRNRISGARFDELRGLYFWGFAQLAWDDGVINQAEIVGIRYVGRMMGKSPEEIDSALRKKPAGWAETHVNLSGFHLESGDLVVLTGDMPKPRTYYEEILAARGIISWPSVTKKVKVVLAADVLTQSGKAKRARVIGIPILPLEEVIAGLP